jgi:hypothetical protein
MHAMLHPEEDGCEAPVSGWRNSGSKLRMQQELREQVNRERAVLAPRTSQKLLTNIEHLIYSYYMATTTQRLHLMPSCPSSALSSLSLYW